MKTISILGVLFIVATSLAQTKDVPKDRCPKPTGSSFGACVFNPDVNCVDDNACKGGQICCPDGCNKVCKDPAESSDAQPKPYISPVVVNNSKGGSCPVVPPTFGACVYNPSVNCMEDSECKDGQLCCNDGCGKICKDVKSPEEAPATPVNQDGQCPEAKRTFGTCVFTPGVNCMEDNECKKDGQLCCPDGCGKVCKDLSPKPKPEEETDNNSSKGGNDERCPANTSFGICKFDPKLNCEDDSKCSNGQICCNQGCGKVCVNPKPVPVHEATKP